MIQIKIFSAITSIGIYIAFWQKLKIHLHAHETHEVNNITYRIRIQAGVDSAFNIAASEVEMIF